jgi:hypothetical protein
MFAFSCMSSLIAILKMKIFVSGKILRYFLLYTLRELILTTLMVDNYKGYDFVLPAIQSILIIIRDASPVANKSKPSLISSKEMIFESNRSTGSLPFFINFK